MSTNRELLDQFSKQTVLLIGDFGADHYLYGVGTRLSREAPVIILRKSGERTAPGQAGNVAMNLAALGGAVECCGVIGDDAQGRELRRALEANDNVVTKGLIVETGRNTVTKTRIYAGAHHAARQQVCRLDDDSSAPYAPDTLERLRQAITEGLERADVVLVSDYGYGLIDAALWSWLRLETDSRGVPLLIDSRYALGEFREADVITPNESEALSIVGASPDNLPPLIDLCRAVNQQTGARKLILTRGNEGMAAWSEEFGLVEIPIHGGDDPVDVTGAGDTVFSVVGLAIAAGANLIEAARLANIAGGLVVMKPGTAVVELKELSQLINAPGT